MKPRTLLLLAALLPAACATPIPPENLSAIPVGELGTNQDSDLASISLSSYTFAETSRMRGNPVGVARSVASVEFLNGEVRSNPRFQTLGSDVGIQMNTARDELRRTLHIPPAAPAQQVVTAMLQTADAILAQNPQAATQALNPAIFTLGPQATLDLLANMPFQTAANIATLRLSHQLFSNDNRVCYGCG